MSLPWPNLTTGEWQERLDKSVKFDENQPRDAHGEWTSGNADWTAAHPDGNAKLLTVAEHYLGTAGLPVPTTHAAQALTSSEGRAIADSYQQSADNPKDQATQAAYEAFHKELDAQRAALEAAGYAFEPWNQAGQPYADSKAMRADVATNRHLFYFRTTEGTIPNGLTTTAQNDTFRAVHDMFGHALGGNQFGPKGETNAFLDHYQMFSPKARLALATETLAQNAWFNFGKANEGKPVTERRFADQKATLLDPKLYAPLLDRLHANTKAAGDAPEHDDYFGCPAHRRPVKGTKEAGHDVSDQPRDEHGRFGSTGGGTFEPTHFFERLAQPDGGFTVSAVTGAEPTGAGHYSVSPYPDAAMAVSVDKLTPKDLAAYVRGHMALLTKDQHYFGGWHDPETHTAYLDVSRVVNSPAEAEQLAREHQQIAYFDFGTGKSVRVDPAKQAVAWQQAKLVLAKIEPDASDFEGTILKVFRHLTGRNATVAETEDLRQSLKAWNRSRRRARG